MPRENAVRELLTLSDRGDTWHLLLHIKQMPCLPKRQNTIMYRTVKFKFNFCGLVRPH